MNTGQCHPRILVLVMSNVQEIWQRRSYDVRGVDRWWRKDDKRNDESRSWQNWSLKSTLTWNFETMGMFSSCHVIMWRVFLYMHDDRWRSWDCHMSVHERASKASWMLKPLAETVTPGDMYRRYGFGSCWYHWGDRRKNNYMAERSTTNSAIRLFCNFKLPIQAAKDHHKGSIPWLPSSWPYRLLWSSLYSLK